MIDLLSRGPVDNSIGGYISLAIGAIFFFVGRSYYARPQAISTGQNKGHNIVIFTAVIGIVGIIIIGAVVFMLILKPLSNSRGSSSNSPMNESPSVAAYSTISLKVPGTYVPVIKVPECDQAALQSGTYLCMHFKGLTGPVAAMLPGGGEGLVLKNHPPEDAEYHLMNGADSILFRLAEVNLQLMA